MQIPVLKKITTVTGSKTNLTATNNAIRITSIKGEESVEKQKSKILIANDENISYRKISTKNYL